MAGSDESKIICHCSKCHSQHAFSARTIRAHLQKDIDLYMALTKQSGRPESESEWTQGLLDKIKRTRDELDRHRHTNTNRRRHQSGIGHSGMDILAGMGTIASASQPFGDTESLDLGDSELPDNPQAEIMTGGLNEQSQLANGAKTPSTTGSESTSESKASSESDEESDETNEADTPDAGLSDEESDTTDTDVSDDSEMEVDSIQASVPTSDAADFKPAQLKTLKEALMAGYKCPDTPPSHPFSQPELTPSEELSLSHFIVWRETNGTVRAYERHGKLLARSTGTEILSLHKVKKLAFKLTKLEPREIDMCRHSCIAYTGQYANLNSCPYIAPKAKEPCGTPRYSNPNKKTPFAQFAVLPVFASIRAMFANATTSSQLRYRDKCLQKSLALVNAGMSMTYSDFPSSTIHVYHHAHLKLFSDARDIAFALSTDGAQLTMKKQSNTWILILILLNLPPEVRYRSSNIIINFATPGPGSPGDIESFLYPLFQEMTEASAGIWMWDALDSSYFMHRAYITMALGDMLGSAKLNGMAGHTAVHGDRFSNIRAARSSLKKGAKAQYYPLNPPQNKTYNPERPSDYSQPGAIVLRVEAEYWNTLHLLEHAKTKTDRKKITKATGISRLPLCAASAAFIHPSFFPLDPFHLCYENNAALFWDLWTSVSYSKLSDPVHMPPAMAQELGSCIAKAMITLPPKFCGPVRDPFLKRQSQFKVYEWMALVHWYIVPICIELKFNPEVVKNFAAFVNIVDFATAIQGRNDTELEQLYSNIVDFLLEYERIYIGNDPEKIARARLCLFQLIHIPIHIRWNGSIRIGSQATVERTIGQMGRKIKSKKAPFANLRNIIVDLELVRILELYYPNLGENYLLQAQEIASSIDSSESEDGIIDEIAPQKLPNPKYRLSSKIKARNPPTDNEALAHYLEKNHSTAFKQGYDVKRCFGKLTLPNGSTIRCRIGEESTDRKKVESSQRQYRWFLATNPVDNSKCEQVYGEAIAFYEIETENEVSQSISLAVYRPLQGVESELSTLRGKWSRDGAVEVIPIQLIIDLIGIWKSHCSDWVYILRRHPGLALLNEVEKGVETVGAQDRPPSN